jgi:hypothetical protein
MRDAIEHREGPIKANQAGIGKTIALSVRETESTIEDGKHRYAARHDDLASWIRLLHALAVTLTNEPGLVALAEARRLEGRDHLRVRAQWQSATDVHLRERISPVADVVRDSRARRQWRR